MSQIYFKSLLIAFICFTTSSLLMAADKVDDDWVCWRGPNGDGKNPTKGIITDWKKGLTKVWENKELCSGEDDTSTWSAPVVKGDKLIVMGRDDDNDIVYCLNAKTGKEIWKRSYASEAGKGFGKGARATPYIDGDTVFTFGRSGDLISWNLSDGKQKWKTNISGAGGSPAHFGAGSSPLIYGDLVIVIAGAGAETIAYNKKTGKVAWKKGGKGSYAAPLIAKINNKDNLIIFAGKKLVSYDPKNGNEAWSSNWVTKWDVNASTPATAGNIIFITSGYKHGAKAIEIKDNKVNTLWENKTISSRHSDPVILDGYVYCFSEVKRGGVLKCVELKTGKEMWSAGKENGTLLFVDGHLLCLTYAGTLMLVKPSPKKFEKVSEFKVPFDRNNNSKHLVWTVPVVAKGNVYVRFSKHLICYKLK